MTENNKQRGQVSRFIYDPYGMIEHSAGLYVFFDDYRALEAKLAEYERQEPVAWMIEPNAQSHAGIIRDLMFDKPHDRPDWEVRPLYAKPTAPAQPLSEVMAIIDKLDKWVEKLPVPTQSATFMYSEIGRLRVLLQEGGK